MAYKQPKNTPIHNHGASEPITAIIGAAKLIKMGVVAAKAAKAAKAAWTAKNLFYFVSCELPVFSKSLNGCSEVKGFSVTFCSCVWYF